MKPERILDAAEVCGWLAGQASNLPEDHDDAAQMQAMLTLVQCYLVDCAKGLVDGLEPYDALLRAARGDTPLPDTPSATTAKLLLRGVGRSQR